MFDLAKGLSRLQLTDEEMALFSAACLLSPDRPWLADSQKVQKLQAKVYLALQHSLHMSGAADEKLDQVRPSTLHSTITYPTVSSHGPVVISCDPPYWSYWCSICLLSNNFMIRSSPEYPKQLHMHIL